MNTHQTANEIIHAIKDMKLEDQISGREEALDNVGAFVSNKGLVPLVIETGSSYTSQNNIKVVTKPNQKEQYDVGDVHYDYIAAVKKPYHIKTVSLSSTTPVEGAAPYVLNLPNDYFSANTVLQNIGNTFLSFAGKMHVLVSVQGSPQYSGACIAYVSHGTSYVTGIDPYGHQRNRMFMQHAILDYSDNSSTADIVVPFRYNKTGTGPFSTVMYLAIAPLAPMGGATSMNVTVSMFVEDPVFRFLKPGTTTFERETQGLLTITNINNTMHDIIDSTLPTHLTGDSVDITPSLMDAVPIATNPNPMVVKYNSVNNSNNPFPVERMGLNAGVERISDETTFGSTEDEMDIKNLLQREHVIQPFTITTTTPINAPNFATYITPTTIWNGLPAGGAMSLLAGQFRYWRGGIKLKLRFFMNRFQSIKLYAAMFYKHSAPTVPVDWSTSHGVTLDIGGDQREVEIEIPYNAETSWLRVPYSSPQDITGDNEYSLGAFALYPVTPLVSPAGSPTSVTCLVTMSVADDFEFATYNSCTATAQGILLASKSIRKPNDIVDVVPSLKTYLKRYHNHTNSVFYVDINKYPIATDIIYPGNVFSNGAATSFFEGAVSVTRPATTRMPCSGIFEGYRGGVTLRIEMTYQLKLHPSEAMKFNLVPFCYYLTLTKADDVIEHQLAKALESYVFNEAFDMPIMPYHVQPINPTVYFPGQQVVFEVDCPYNGVNKYQKHTDSGTHTTENGVILCGFYTPNKDWGQEVPLQIHIRTSKKISDDGRFGIPQNASFSLANTVYNWGAT